ncbi:hypothetical protein BC938DRAFT_477368, partial [Jimgerdemannia flammicorona]
MLGNWHSSYLGLRLAMTDTTLSCLVLGEDPDIKTFDLDIARSKTINKLKEAIKEKIQLDYSAKDLTL